VNAGGARDREGNINAVEDRCPHRGARLSLGWNLGDRVACGYHGVEVNGQGVVVDIPAVETRPMVGEQRRHAYPACERQGAIFLYFGDEGHTRVFFWRVRRVRGWQRGVSRFLYRNRLEGLHWAVLEQDRIVLEQMAPDAREDEFLYQHDMDLIRVRRLMEKAARAAARMMAPKEASGLAWVPGESFMAYLDRARG